MGQRIGSQVKARLAPHRQYVLPSPEIQPEEAGKERGLYAGEPEACRRRLLPFLRTMTQLGLLLAVAKVYHVEGRAFQALTTLALAALPVHYLAPFRWKKPVFVAVSVGGLFWVFGNETAGLVTGFAAVLIGVCYLPVRWPVRAALVAGLGGAMAAARPESVLTAIPSTVWAVLASMFMFRVLIYLYELKHSRKPEPLVDTLSYFFVLPNYCFMHFPVVDYRTMQRGYFAGDVHEIQHQGLRMMFRGTVHLLLYRVIYHELLIPAAEVRGPWSLAAFLVCNYLLYLRVSGQFHMACGMLHLFGYQLPETHHHYLLATSFTDYWRRINIYWKDFMVRLFFNPVVFRLKRWPQPAALAAATATVFLATWLLHAYQSYWLRGTWGFSGPDAVFWGVLGVLVLVNVQFDARRGRARAGLRKQGQAASAIEFRPLAVRVFKTAATFTTIALLWSLWSSPSLEAWLDLLRRGLLGT